MARKAPPGKGQDGSGDFDFCSLCIKNVSKFLRLISYKLFEYRYFYKSREYALWQHSDATIGGTGQDRLNNLGGTQLSLNGFTSATINDTNDTGVTGDADTDDESPTGPENWLINGSTKTLLEVVVYDNSILYLNDGTSVQLDVVMFLYDDGTYAFSAKSITDGMPNDISELNPNNIDYTQGITLGTQRALPSY